MVAPSSSSPIASASEVPSPVQNPDCWLASPHSGQAKRASIALFAAHREDRFRGKSGAARWKAAPDRVQKRVYDRAPAGIAELLVHGRERRARAHDHLEILLRRFDADGRREEVRVD